MIVTLFNPLSMERLYESNFSANRTATIVRNWIFFRTFILHELAIATT